MSTKQIFMISLIALLIILIITGGVLGFMYFNNKKTPEKPEIKYYYYNAEEIICNPKDSRDLLKFNMTIEVTEESLLKSFEEKKFLIRDKVNEILTSKTEKEIREDNKYKKIKEEITGSLKEVFDNDNIKTIYIQDIIIQ